MQALCTATGLVVTDIHDDSTAFQFWASEQALAKVPLTAESSMFVDPERSPFTPHQVRDWTRSPATQSARQGRPGRLGAGR